ncbi:MAG: serine/threonine-protein kinase [Bryobacterales bacterium]|nr:serine/threonine-protein kinase [Bryobacterales bacterium]
MLGRTLAHYEIVETLGEGGMGTVYKARDQHLDRFVALKLLRSDKPIDDERRRRFIQEAKAASALNHPHIVTIHDIGSDQGTDFIVMEYVAGRTLDSLIPRQGMRIEEILRIAIPVADALSKAHAAGILHRDLKPSNIMVDGEGRAKLLDFGLAKLTDRSDLTQNDATVTRRADTVEGSILGTVAYMSPEQAEGKKPDARSDLFSFGAVLYEMTTGQRAFEGDTPLSTLAAVIHKEPKPVGELSPVAPRDLDRIIARCMRKDPERRYQTMRDVRNALEELKEDSESGKLLSAPITSPESRTRGRLRWIPVVAGLLLAAGAAWLWSSRPRPAAPALDMRPLTSGAGLTTSPAISPDGRFVAYASDRATGNDLDIWIQPLTKGAEPIRLTQHESDDSSPTFSPDGGLIAYVSRRDGGGIYVVPALGGQERLLVRGGSSPRFSPDGSSLGYTATAGPTSFLSESKIYLLPVGGGTPRQLASEVPWASGPRFSPDGKYVLFDGMPSSNATGEFDWWVAPVDGGPPVKTGLIPALRQQGVPYQVATAAPAWFENSILFDAGGHIWEVEMDPKTWKAAGPARQVTAGAGPFSGAQAVRVGGGMRMVFTVSSRARRLFSLPLDPKTGKAAGELEPLTYSGSDQYGVTGSTDGSKLVFLQSDPNGVSLRVRQMATGAETTLLSAQVRATMSPDGSMVAFAESGRKQLSVIPASGGEAIKLLDLDNAANLYGWSRDSKRIVYWDGSPTRFSWVDAQSRQTGELISHPKYDIHGASLSPDQRWVLFHTPLLRKTVIRIAPVRDGRAAGEEEWITVVDRETQNSIPSWSHDGALVYFCTTMDGSRCLYAQRLDMVTKRPTGDPFAIYHFHRSRIRLPAGLIMGGLLVPDRYYMALLEVTGNVWIAESKE